jgi:hypothetical protein
MTINNCAATRTTQYSDYYKGNTEIPYKKLNNQTHSDKFKPESFNDSTIRHRFAKWAKQRIKISTQKENANQAHKPLFCKDPIDIINDLFPGFSQLTPKSPKISQYRVLLQSKISHEISEAYIFYLALSHLLSILGTENYFKGIITCLTRTLEECAKDVSEDIEKLKYKQAHDHLMTQEECEYVKATIAYLENHGDERCAEKEAFAEQARQDLQDCMDKIRSTSDRNIVSQNKSQSESQSFFGAIMSLFE